MSPRVRQAVLLTVVFLAGILLGHWHQPAGGQQPAAGKVGKYQVAVCVVNNVVHGVLCDTETGQLWARVEGAWKKAAVPPVNAK
jgi:hypothetical protein